MDSLVFYVTSSSYQTTFSEKQICIDMVKSRTNKFTKLQPSWMTNEDKQQRVWSNHSSTTRKIELIQSKTKPKNFYGNIRRERNYWQSMSCIREAFIVLNIYVTCVPYARNLSKGSLRLMALQLRRWVLRRKP